MNSASRRTLGVGSWAFGQAACNTQHPTPNNQHPQSASGPQRPTPNARRLRKGFTLIEAIAAIALVSIGVVSTMSGLAVMAKTDRLILERERMQKMAVQKYDEIIATGQIDTAELSGDFTEQNIDGYEWSATIEPSGEENLEILTIAVNKTGDAEGPQATMDGLLFRPPIQGGAQ